MRLLSEADVRRLVDPDAAIRASAEAYRLLSTGAAEVPLRTEIPRPEVGGVVLVMPGLVRGRVFGLKIIGARTEGTADGAPETVSMVLLFDAETQVPLGMFAADDFTDLRTAAGLAAATDVLARPDAETMVVFGAGKLAGPSVRLIRRVRRLRRVLVIGRSPARLARLVAGLRADPELAHLAVEDAVPAEEAVPAADIVTAVTSSTTPVFDGRLVRPGTHLNIAGAYRPDMRELDDAIAARAHYYVDSAASCLERAGDLCQPLSSGVLTRDRLRGEIGLVFAGEVTGRRSVEEVTVFKSLGNAVQDLVLGEELLRDARGGLDFDHLGGV